jgi:hypothetical protein
MVDRGKVNHLLLQVLIKGTIYTTIYAKSRREFNFGHLNLQLC